MSGLQPTIKNINKNYLLSTLPIVDNSENPIQSTALEAYMQNTSAKKFPSKREFAQWSNQLNHLFENPLNNN